ncbi:MAG: methylmalonyl-CoA mutase family protein [Planctomycetes bacterium]|nr:methylmalonyl-CoA mutase family protein [Planctomycetota bacterium]
MTTHTSSPTANSGGREPSPRELALAQRSRWEAGAARLPRRQEDRFVTVSLREVPELSDPFDDEGRDFAKDIAYPGEYPYTRGIHRTGYRGKMWTMRQFAGFGSAADTNARYKYLLGAGQTGLSVAFDLPTLMGYDSDHEFSEGEVGKCGVAIACLDDMKRLFEGIPLDKVSTSMTINSPAAILLAMYVAAAKAQGVTPNLLRGTVQNDILKEYIAQKEYIFPPVPSLRIITDMMRYCADDVPQWNTISVSGYHIREAGSTAVQELAFTLLDGFTYVECGIKAGMDVDEFAPRISHFWNAHQDFFEELCKYRAGRRIWARHMREKYGATDPKSWLLRFHTQTAGVSLTAQQPENNIVRTAIEALSAVLGGTQSLHTNSMDETLALPTEKSVKIALRTQQIIAYETGVAHVIDPLGGSWYVEKLTDQMEKEAEEIFAKVEQMGGVVRCIEEGWFQREIARSAYEYQKAVDKGDKVIVGVNKFVEQGEKLTIELLKIDASTERSQTERLKALRARRDAAKWSAALEAVRAACVDGSNLMPRLVTAVEADATLGEIIDTMKSVFGTYEETPEF